MTTNTEQLLPCPFCGSQAKMIRTKGESLWSHDQVEWTQVQCTNDDCGIETDNRCEGWEPTPAETWNARAALTQPAQAGEAVTKDRLPVAGYSNARGEEEALVYLKDALALTASQEQAQQPDDGWALARAQDTSDYSDRGPSFDEIKQQPSGGEVVLPAGWVPLTIEHEPGYPEEVAFGPQRMMDRLKKWLDKHFATLVTKPVPMTDDQVWHSDGIMSANGIAGFKFDALMRIVRAVEAHHGITSTSTKEPGHG